MSARRLARASTAADRRRGDLAHRRKAPLNPVPVRVGRAGLMVSRRAHREDPQAAAVSSRALSFLRGLALIDQR